MIEVRKPPFVQVALDFESMEQALQVASEVAPYVDILEAGTPLIKSEGIRIVKALKDAHPDKIICADLKIADAGYLEVRMAAKAKANIITVLADAYDITILETLRAAHEFDVEIMADLIMSRKPAKRLKEIIDLNYKNTKLHYSLVHSGLDRQESRHSPLSEIESVAYMQNRPKLAIAGGITKSEIPKLKSYPIDIIIIGGAITRAENPKKVAEEIRKLVNLTY